MFFLMLGLFLLYSCNQKQPITNGPEGEGTLLTQQEALSAVVNYLNNQPEANLYVLDSAEAIDADTQWQVLVPRTDWANRMPNRAAFDVDKRTGKVSIRPVK